MVSDKLCKSKVSQNARSEQSFSSFFFIGQELDSKLQSAEARCKILEKQLDYMKKMVENTKRQSETLNQNQQFNSPIPQIQQDKLEKLESECLKLSKTQTAAEVTPCFDLHNILLCVLIS